MEVSSELRLILAVSFDAAIKIDGEEGRGGRGGGGENLLQVLLLNHCAYSNFGK